MVIIYGLTGKSTTSGDGIVRGKLQDDVAERDHVVSAYVRIFSQQYKMKKSK